MERVSFLVEGTGERLDCLLNPEGLDRVRRSGIRSRAHRGGLLSGRGLNDDPLVYTGGGMTELQLDLLFDVTLVDSPTALEDVRTLTSPLWELSENSVAPDGYGSLRLVRFIWGKAWNVLGVVAGISERFECFSPDGEPGRSWLRIRFVRVSSTEEPPSSKPLATAEEIPGLVSGLRSGEVQSEDHGMQEVVGGGGSRADQGAPFVDRLDQVAESQYGDPSLWRLVASFNDIDDPFRLPIGTQLRVPTLNRRAPG